MPLGFGEKVGEAYVRIFANADSVPGDIRRGIDDAGPTVHDGGEDLGRELGDGMDEGFQQRLKLINTNDFNRRMREMVKGLDLDFKDTDFAGLGAVLAGVDDSIDDVGDASRRNRHWVERLSGSLGGVNDHLDVMADRMGAVTGRGSRNNFLNFIGSLTRNFAKLISLPIRGFVGLIGKFSESMAEGKGVGGGLDGVLDSLWGTVKAGIPGLITLAAAIVALYLVIGPLAAALSLLAGIVTALVASIGFALVAAVASLAAIALPAFAAIAVALGGILSMSDKMKEKFSDAFEPIKDSFVDLGDVAAEVFTGGLTDQADRLSKILGGLEPLVRGIAEAIVDVGNSWLDMMEGPGFADFIDAMTRFLPDAIRRLGDIFGQALGGFGGILRGMIPFMRDVLRYLDGITQRFSDWANSAKGQNEIKDFFDRAAESLAAVWGFLSDVWDLLATILSAGKNTGDSIFERMGNTIQGWIETLEKNPDILKDWFADAESFARSIGHAIEGLARFFDALDNPDTRQAIVFIGDMIESWANLMAKMVNFLSDSLHLVADIFSFLSDKWDQFVGVLDSILSKIQEIKDSIPGMPDIGFGNLGLNLGGGDEKPMFDASWFGDTLANIPQIPDETWTKILNFPENEEVKKHFEDVARWAGMVFEGKAIDFFEIIDWGNTEDVTKKMQPLVNAIMKPLKGLFFDIMDMFGIPHPERIADKVRAVDIPGRIENAIGNDTVDVEKAFKIPDPAAIARNFARQAQAIMSAIGIDSVDLERAFDVPSPQSIADQFVSLASQILNAVGIIDLGRLFRMPATVQAPVVVDQNGHPVDTPHGRIMPGDTAVTAAVGPSWTATGGKTINASGWTIVSPTEDPEAVATEVVNQLAAVGY